MKQKCEEIIIDQYLKGNISNEFKSKVLAGFKLIKEDNPVLKELNFNFSFSENIHFEILDRQGKIVTTGMLSASEQQINVNDLEKGLYVLRFLEGNYLSRKFLKL
jgi:uncharacterized protein YehS (DUF1456 family)